MRRMLSLITVLGCAVALAGCDKHGSVSSDVHSAGQQVNHTVADVSHDPTVRQAETELRQAGRDAGHDLHKAADEARDAFRHLTHDTHHTAHQDAGRDS